MLDGALEGAVVGGVGLDDDESGEVAPSGASGDLGDELEGAFGGAEVGDMESDVGLDDADEGDLGEIESLGDHLGADEDVEFAGAELFEDALVGVLGGHGVGVHARDAGLGEECLGDGLDLFGAEAGEADFGVAAVGAGGWGSSFGAAEVAGEESGLLVVGVGEAAVLAGGDVAAFGAHELGGEAAAVEEEDGLLGLVESVVDEILESSGEDLRLSGDGGLLGHVDELDGGHGSDFDASEEFDEPVLADFAVVVAFE